MSLENGFFGPNEVLIDYLTKLNDPGRYPFTRGIFPEMFRKKNPTLRQFAGHGLARDTNERFKKIIALGGTGLSTAFDLPTLYGDDSDAPLSRHEVGWDGVAIDRLEDMDELFSGIPIDKLTVSMTINAPAAIIRAMYNAVAKKRGIPLSSLRGTIQNDIFKEHIAQNEVLYPLKHGIRLAVDVMAARSNFHEVSVSGYHIREAGSSAVQEVAYTLADGIAYVEELLKRGLKIEEFAPRLSFFFDAHNNFFEEIAKFRAARRLWAEIMHKRFRVPILENYDLKDTKLQSLWCRMHAQTAGCTLTRNQPLTNLMRINNQALAALLGGVQSIHTNSYDEVLCVPTEKGVKMAIRTQQILLEETNITNWVDPLAGAYQIEYQTEKIYEEAKKEISVIESFGGMAQAIEELYPQKKIHENAIADRETFEQWKNDPNKKYFFEQDDTADEDLAEISEEVEKRRGYESEQKDRLSKFKKQRYQTGALKALAKVRRAAEKKDNLMPVLQEAVESSATLGEICGALRDVWGSAKESAGVSSSFSHKKALEFTKGYRFPRPMRVLLAKGGHDGHTVGFYILRDIFQAMGAEVIHFGFRTTPEAIAKAAVEEGVDFIGLSALIGYVPGFFEDLKNSLKSYGGSDIEIIGGGIMLPAHEKYIKETLGIKNIYVPGSSDFDEIVQNMKKRTGQ